MAAECLCELASIRKSTPQKTTEVILSDTIAGTYVSVELG